MMSEIGNNSKSPSLNNLSKAKKVNTLRMNFENIGYGSKLKMKSLKGGFMFDRSKYTRSLSNNRANQVVIAKSSVAATNGKAKAEMSKKSPSLNKLNTLQDKGLKKNQTTKFNRNRNPKDLLNGISNQFLLNSYSLKSIEKKTTKANKNPISPKSIKSNLSNVSRKTNNSYLDNSRVKSPVLSNKSQDNINRSDILSHNYIKGNGIRKTMLGKAWNPHPLQMNFNKKTKEQSTASRPSSVNTTSRSYKINPKDIFSQSTYSNYKNRLFSNLSNKNKTSRSNVTSTSIRKSNTLGNSSQEMKKIEKTPPKFAYNLKPMKAKPNSGLGISNKFSQNFSNKIISIDKLPSKPSKGNILMKVEKRNDIHVEMSDDQQDYLIKGGDREKVNDVENFFDIKTDNNNHQRNKNVIIDEKPNSYIDNRENKFTKKNIYDKKIAKSIFRQNNTSPFTRAKWTKPSLNSSSAYKKSKPQAEDKKANEMCSKKTEDHINVIVPRSLINSNSCKVTSLDEPTGSHFIDELLRNSDIRSLISNTKSSLPPKAIENKPIAQSNEKSIIPQIAEESSKRKIRKIKRMKTVTKTGVQDNEEKKNNQDIAIIKENFMGNSNHYFLSVCDGHGYVGHEVSQFIKERLPYNLESLFSDERIDIKSDDKMKLHRIIENAFLKTNNQLNNSEIDSKFSGSTCVSCFLTEDRIISANIGDSRAVLGKRNSNGGK